jgi:hypothetical protein
MVVMRRIVDENYQIKYPPYLSPQAKVSSSLVNDQDSTLQALTPCQWTRINLCHTIHLLT